MKVTINDISNAVITLGLSNRPICIHSSLRSFGWVEGGTEAIIQGFLNQGCTILVPTFSSTFAVNPPINKRPLRNGSDYSSFNNNKREDNKNIFNPQSNELDKDMGTIPDAILKMKGRKRGNHPLNSFSALGPLSSELISDQHPRNVYAPLKSLAKLSGSVILMGVGLESLTALHLAEQMAGRNMFHRWAKNSTGSTMEVIEKNPIITHCLDSDCQRCNDAVLGGPLL